MYDRWRGHCMKKFGQSIRAKIFEAYQGSFARAVVLSRVEGEKEEALEDLMMNIPEHKWLKA
jgi:hypothetical protein